MNKWRPAAAHIPPAAGLNLRANHDWLLSNRGQRNSVGQSAGTFFERRNLRRFRTNTISYCRKHLSFTAKLHSFGRWKNVRLMSPLSVGERWSVKYLQDIQTLSTLVGAIVYEDMEVA